MRSHNGRAFEPPPPAVSIPPLLEHMGPTPRGYATAITRTTAGSTRPVPLDRLHGRAVVLWWATHGGVPQWDRIGLPIE